MDKIIFKKSATSIFKIFVGVFLVYTTALILNQKDKFGIIYGLVLLFCFTLPTVFVVYFKEEFIKKFPTFSGPWKFLRIIYAIIVVLFVLLLAFSAFRAAEKNKTRQVVEFINSKKITLDDAMGKNLPSEPDKTLNNSTIAGIDANNNYIRDDVELAIFKNYPNSAKIRAAELQYAQALQLELTQIFNSETLIPLMQKKALAFDCLGFSGPDKSLESAIQKENEVEKYILNTEIRKNKHLEIYENFMTSYLSTPGQECDIALGTLSN